MQGILTRANIPSPYSFLKMQKSPLPISTFCPVKGLHINCIIHLRGITLNFIDWHFYRLTDTKISYIALIAPSKSAFATPIIILSSDEPWSIIFTFILA